MPVQFFLKHQFIKELMTSYGYGPLDPQYDPPANEYKGLIFTVDFKQDKGSTNYIATATAEGAKGRPDKGTGSLPRIPNTEKIMCPHPPPCPVDANGNFLKDLEGNFIIDKANPAASCYK